ncbi:MAG: PAS domain S-box protein [Planctomycetia bacterium]|nr:PAS domain S-box protein [Planctomycetia bacterium]
MSYLLSSEPNSLFRSVFEQSAFGIALVDLNGRWMKVNRALCGLVGYSEGELLSFDLQSITHPADSVKPELEQLQAGEVDYCHVEARFFHKSGQCIWVSLCASLVRGEAGKPGFCAIQLEDITVRKLAEDALRQSEARFRNLADFDPLTGLLNRRSFRDQFEREWSRSLRHANRREFQWRCNGSPESRDCRLLFVIFPKGGSVWRQSRLPKARVTRASSHPHRKVESKSRSRSVGRCKWAWATSLDANSSEQRILRRFVNCNLPHKITFTSPPQ